MKKIILTAMAVVAFYGANAQDVKQETKGFANGDVFVTGALTLGSSNDKNTDIKTNSFEIVPQVGFFVSENIAIGGKIGFASEKMENDGVDVMDLSGLSLGAFGRYYFTPANAFSLFGQVEVEYASLKEKLDDVKINGFGAGLGLGMNYFVSSNFSIEAGLAVLSFANAKADADGAEASSEFSFGGDLRAVTFGVNYKF